MNPKKDKPPIGVFAIVVQGAEILLIKRGIQPHKGFWCPPGGVIDEGETPEEATVRETLEETGALVEVISFLGEVMGPISGLAHNVYLCKQEGGSLNSDSPEVDEATYVPFTDLNTYRIPSFIKDFLKTLDFHELEKQVKDLA